jgi:hypothetical protein
MNLTLTQLSAWGHAIEYPCLTSRHPTAAHTSRKHSNCWYLCWKSECRTVSVHGPGQKRYSRHCGVWRRSIPFRVHVVTYLVVAFQLHKHKSITGLFCTSCSHIRNKGKQIFHISVVPMSSLENRDYGRRESATLTMRHPSTCKSWHYLRRQAAVARSV